MQKKILITGAGGFIGSHLVDTLLSEGVQAKNIRILLWNDEPSTNLPTSDFEIVRGDVRDKKLMSIITKDIDTVYHLAARIDFDGPTYAEYQDVNALGTQYLIDGCKKHGVKKFVLYSTIGIYGLPAATGPIENWDETHKPTFTNFYGQSKWEAEERVRKAHQDFGLAYAIIRPASVYGPREKGPTLALYKAIQSGMFLQVGNGKNKMHYVYVQDLVDATILAAKSKIPNGEYIIGGVDAPTLVEVVTCVSASISKAAPKGRLPLVLALPIAHVCAVFNSLFGLHLPLFPSRVRTMVTPYYYNISKAKKEIGYSPKISFKKGTRITGNWYLEHGYL